MVSICIMKYTVEVNHSYYYMALFQRLVPHSENYCPGFLRHDKSLPSSYRHMDTPRTLIVPYPWKEWQMTRLLPLNSLGWNVLISSATAWEPVLLCKSPSGIQM